MSGTEYTSTQSPPGRDKSVDAGMDPTAVKDEEDEEEEDEEEEEEEEDEEEVTLGVGDFECVDDGDKCLSDTGLMLALLPTGSSAGLFAVAAAAAAAAAICRFLRRSQRLDMARPPPVGPGGDNEDELEAG